jgi:hypothetical protein
MLQHLLGHFKVGDDAIFHGPNGNDITGSSPQHILRVTAYGFYLIGDFVYGNY